MRQSGRCLNIGFGKGGPRLRGDRKRQLTAVGVKSGALAKSKSAPTGMLMNPSYGKSRKICD